MKEANMARESVTVEENGQTGVEEEEDDTELDEDEIAGEVNLEKLQAWFPTFRAPIAMRLLLEERAAEAKLNVPQYMKKIVADHIKYALPAGSSRSTMTEVEKEAKRKEYAEKAKAERQRVKAILEQQRKAEGLVTAGK